MPACLGSPPQSPQSHARLHQHALSLAHADLTLVSSSSRVQVLSKGVHTNVTSHPSFGTDNFVTMIATHAFRFAVPVRASASVRSTVRPVSVRASPVVRKDRTQLSRPSLRCRATEEKELDVEKEVAKSAKKIAETFAPRGSGDAAALGGKKKPGVQGQHAVHDFRRTGVLEFSRWSASVVQRDPTFRPARHRQINGHVERVDVRSAVVAGARVRAERKRSAELFVYRHSADQRFNPDRVEKLPRGVYRGLRVNGYNVL